MRSIRGVGLALFVALVSVAGLGAVENNYVGAKACAVCHTTGKGGHAYAVWGKSAHAKAFEELKHPSDEKPKDGLNPWESPSCLKCHVTGGGAATNVEAGFSKEEGVSCEACHGAGSAYIAIHVKGDLAESKAAGMNPIDLTMVCGTCHRDKEFKFAEKWPKIKHELEK